MGAMLLSMALQLDRHGLWNLLGPSLFALGIMAIAWVRAGCSGHPVHSRGRAEAEYRLSPLGQGPWTPRPRSGLCTLWVAPPLAGSMQACRSLRGPAGVPFSRLQAGRVGEVVFGQLLAWRQSALEPARFIPDSVLDGRLFPRAVILRLLPPNGSPGTPQAQQRFSGLALPQTPPPQEPLAGLCGAKCSCSSGHPKGSAWAHSGP